MQLTITSISLPAEAVQRLIENYLNDLVFQARQHVTGVECIDEAFIVTLEPAHVDHPEEGYFDELGNWRVLPRPPANTIYTTVTAPIPGQINGNSNGHHADADLVGADLGVRPDVVPAPTPEVTPAEAPKRRSVTPEQDAEILRLHAEGYPLSRIADATGIKIGTIDYRIGRSGKADGAG